MILTISVVSPSDVLAPPLTFINVTTGCDQGPRKRGALRFHISQTSIMSFLETLNSQNSEMLHIRSMVEISPSDRRLQSNRDFVFHEFKG
jgi:hypothetical protein